MIKPWTLDPDRRFDPSPARRRVARSLYEELVREFAHGREREAVQKA
jgi:hypothetical protein